MGQAYKNARREEAVKQASQKKMRMLMLLSIVVIILIAGGIVVAQRTAGDGTSDVFKLSTQPMLGQADAPVTIVEFGDFKCPVCMQFSKDIYPKLKQDFIDTGIAKMYFVNYAFIGPDSTTAAMALESVYHQKPEAAWPFIEAMYRNQGDERKLWATPEVVAEIARKENVGVDYDKLLSDLKQNKYINDVRSDNSIAAKKSRSGTPTIYVNGKEIGLPVVFNYDQFKEEVQKAQQPGAAQK